MIDNPAWPAADRDRARALVWCRMGRNADEAARHGRRLQPNAETCFKRASQLAPDLLEPYEQTFLMLRDRNQIAPAMAAGKRLAEAVPGSWHGAGGDGRTVPGPRATSRRALEYARRARGRQPARRAGCGPAGRRVCARAPGAAAVGNFAGGRGRSGGSASAPRRPARRRACSPKPRPSRSRPAMPTRRRSDVRRPGLSPRPPRRMLWPSKPSRLKLPKTLKQRFEAEFAAALAAPPTGPAAVALADAFSTRTARAIHRPEGARKEDAGVRRSGDRWPIPARPTWSDLCERARRPGLDAAAEKSRGSQAKSGSRATRFFPFSRPSVHMSDEPAVGPATVEDRAAAGEGSRRLAGQLPRPTRRFANCSATWTACSNDLSVPAPVVQRC